MCDAKQSTTHEFRLDHPLDLRISFGIDAACRFVKNDDSAVLDKSPAEREELLFSRAIVGTFVAYCRVEAKFRCGGFVDWGAVWRQEPCSLQS